MKISVFSLPEISLGKQNVKDSRLDQVDAITKAKKKTYVQVDLVDAHAVIDADAILAASDVRADLILRDLEFVETRLGRSEQPAEKEVLSKLKGCLEKEQLVLQAGLSDEEKKLISGYSLLTAKPVILVGQAECAELGSVFARALRESGYISFFTTGEKETRAWLIKQGTIAWEAAGAIHSDIQKGFIRAEIISFEDFIGCGGESRAKQAGKMRLEQKEYVMQDADLVNFRFNK